MPTSKKNLIKIYQYPSEAAEVRLSAIENRDLSFKKKDLVAVERIIADVKKNGDKALIKYVNRFDSPGLDISAVKVTAAEWEQAEKQVDRSFMRALNRAQAQIEGFHRKQMPRSWLDASGSGKLLGQLVNPVDSAGVYVPGGTGGKTPLVSSVLMGAVPAKIAGVPRISMVTPPDKNGAVNAHILVAAKKAGVHAVYKIGSAWAIAALAYGTETIPRCDIIVGPGNIYVTLAKKALMGNVGIDIIAGPSEILIIADDTATPAFVAADLLSQAEHDRFASALLITTSEKTARAVGEDLDKQLVSLPRRDIARQSLENFGAVLIVPDMDTAFKVANRIAPEHLELHIQNPLEQIGKIRHAGAVFIGEYTPEPVGDYIAGPNHVLPTAGTARFASALSVETFIKRTSLIYYPEAEFKKEAADIVRLAETEGLSAHANSVKIRMAPVKNNR